MKATLLTTALVLTAAAAVNADEPSYPASHAYGMYHPAYPVTPRLSYFGYRHASTLEEGIQRGFADVIRAKGEYNFNTAVAAKRPDDVGEPNAVC